MKVLNQIIVTGADGMGKTSLVETLTQEYHLPFLGHGGGPIEDLADAITRLCTTMEQPFGVQDRCCATDDPIYSAAFERDQVLPTHFYNTVLRGWNPHIIVCNTAVPAISKTPKGHKSKELLNGVIEKAVQIQELYLQRMKSLKAEGVRVHFYNWKLDPTARHLVDYLQAEGVIV